MTKSRLSFAGNIDFIQIQQLDLIKYILGANGSDILYYVLGHVKTVDASLTELNLVEGENFRVAQIVELRHPKTAIDSVSTKIGNRKDSLLHLHVVFGQIAIDKLTRMINNYNIGYKITE